ncbi:hypothetical protein SRL2020226_59570 [Mycobacterium kiyosense]|uniref:Uncharacterized protein n=1 Tax=Mycobacterium kiyosense TaxID=2871094 RepID=A0AA37Q3N9_9MYCO|nr:hypothetical protein SRL2020028_61140 [Mycobacterium kiyosense]GLB99181.1 hypothetical protein SRL2020226_59570 [Mycobacterium kiyosense]
MGTDGPANSAGMTKTLTWRVSCGGAVPALEPSIDSHAPTLGLYRAQRAHGGHCPHQLDGGKIFAVGVRKYTQPDPDHPCLVCDAPSELVVQAVAAWGGSDEAVVSQVRRCTDPRCDGRQGVQLRDTRVPPPKNPGLPGLPSNQAP